MQLFDTKQFIKLDGKDYLLVITPSEEVILKVIYYKSEVKKRIGFFPSFNSTAHITVNHYFNRNALSFEENINYYDKKLQCEKPIEVKVCGFGYFKHGDTYTIYAKIELNPEVNATFSRFRKILGPHVPNTPHITIARGLSLKNRDLLWEYFEHEKFECSFYATKIVVLETPTRRFFNEPMRLKTELGFNFSD
jgi:2'-5' RNA ligase